MNNCSSAGESGPCCRVPGPYVFAVLAALLVVTGLVWTMKHFTTPPPLAAERAALRTQNLAELRGAEIAAMTAYGWVDQPRGIVRLTVDRAVEMTVAGGGDLAAFRRDLLARLEKATYVPPKPPEKPGEFE